MFDKNKKHTLKQPVYLMVTPKVKIKKNQKISFAAMLQGFFTLYYLVKNVPPSKEFFKFCKEPDRFCIYHKTTPNARWQCVSFPKQTGLHLIYHLLSLD